MIRFIDLGFQIEPFPGGRRCFAWWDTIHDEFIKFSGDYAWHSWESFIEFRALEPQMTSVLLERLRGLYPKDWTPETLP